LAMGGPIIPEAIDGADWHRDLATRYSDQPPENEAVATLELPFITLLLDGGTTDDGILCFVMEYNLKPGRQ